MEKLEAKVKFCKYINESNGFTVLECKTADRKICVSGNNLPTEAGSYIFYGSFGTYYNKRLKKEEKSFSAISYEVNPKQDKEGIIRYLKTFDGIGPVIAKRIYDAFGSDTLDVLSEDVDRLDEVIGISTKKKASVKKAYKDGMEFRKTLETLLLLGLSNDFATRVYALYKEDSLKEIERNPYNLYYKFSGIAFTEVDRIAVAHYKVSQLDQRRIYACMEYILKSNLVTGSLGMEQFDFMRRLQKLLSNGFTAVSGKTVSEIACKAASDKFIKACTHQNGNRYIFLSYMVEWEETAAKKFIQLRDNVQSIPLDEAFLKEVIKRNGFNPDAVQLSAIKSAIQDGVHIITGGPGTGKTTVVKIIIDYLEQKDYRQIVMIAPTGRAANVLEENSGHPTSTIHSAIGLGVDDKGEPEEIRNSIIIVDEFSMVSSKLFYQLMKSVQDGCKMIIVGDANQLPSVGAGNVFDSLIKSETVGVSWLVNIYRQAGDSSIPLNAKKINEGDCNLEEDECFRVVEDPDIEKRICDDYKKEVEEIGLENIVLLSPMKNYTAGVNVMNNLLQETCNPSGESIKIGDTEYRKGDPILNTVNFKDEDGELISNGEVGFVDGVSDSIREKFPSKSIWLYTGYTLQECKKDEQKMAILGHVDVLCDGEFKEELKSPDKPWVGSSNQNVIFLRKEE